MSEQKPISPLLDGLILGEPVSDHHGVRCCPAIREDTEDQYIVKIISIPATQVQLDALLLTGACTDEAQALTYFKELSDGVVEEIEILTRLHQLEGFTPYLGHQLRQMTTGTGFEVYLLSEYKRSLEKLMTAQPLTHLAAVNLGLDLCAALAACRRAGYLYVALKPGNIFLSDTQGYQIGDLGFIPLSSLKYASLPEKYRSSYTAPEISDAMSTLNDTMDIYALGLVLYQVYNNGQLPFDGDAPAVELPSPMYADYEMAEIILKACAPDPQNRWQDPAQMGQALIDYMQRNGVNDTPIIPPPVTIEEPEEEVQEFISEEENDEEFAALLAMIPDEIPPEQLTIDDTSDIEEVEIKTENAEEEPTDEETVLSEPDDQQLSFIDEEGQLLELAVDKDMADILAQADDLIAHEPPEPAVAPEPIDIPIPPPIVEEPEAEAEDEEAAPAEPDETAAEANADAAPAQPKPKRRYRGWIAAAIILILLIGAGVGGYIWYNEIYIQSVEAIQITGSVDQIQVSVISEANPELLTVVCTDTYGNTFRSPVSNGTATFTQLNPATQYRIRLEIAGVHQLVGQLTGSYTTASVTEILDFSAICGPADCSVSLFFSVKGMDDAEWNVAYSTPGEVERTVALINQTATVFGLKENAEYTFRLLPPEGVYLSGTTEVTYTPSKILIAQDLQITACGEGSMTVQWQAPDAPAGQKWFVRCYNDAGFDKTLTVAETTCVFTELDHANGYKIIVTADGMNQSADTSVTANPVTITGYTAELTAPLALALRWDFTGTAPAAGWKVSYTAEGGEPVTFTCSENHVQIVLSAGSSYTVTVTPADDTTCFGQAFTYETAKMTDFEGYGLSADTIELSMVLHPGKKNWSRYDLKDEDYRTAFTVGESAGFLLHASKTYDTSRDQIVTTFVIRDSLGRLVSANTQTATWLNMWYQRYCELDLPAMPEQTGTYTVDIYFNGMYLGSQQFTIA